MIRKKLNPKSNAGNVLKLNKSESGCCGDEEQVCLYVFEGMSDLVNLTSLTFKSAIDGSSVVIDTSGQTEAIEVQRIIQKAFLANGFYDDGADSITYTESSPGRNSLSILGEVVITNAFTDEPLTVVSRCTKVLKCDYEFFVGDVAGVPVVYGSHSGNITLDYPSTTLDAIYGLLKTIMTEGYPSIRSITNDTADSKYKIVLQGDPDQVITIDGVAGKKVRCYGDYVA